MRKTDGYSQTVRKESSTTIYQRIFIQGKVHQPYCIKYFNVYSRTIENNLAILSYISEWVRKELFTTSTGEKKKSKKTPEGNKKRMEEKKIYIYKEHASKSLRVINRRPCCMDVEIGRYFPTHGSCKILRV